MSDDTTVEVVFDRALLERWRPAVHYDPQDPYRALSARSTTDNPGNVLALADATVLARAGDDLTLELLAGYPPPSAAAAGDRIDQTPDPVAAARRFQRDPAYANRAYGRIARHGGRRWLQYWFWFYYNPKQLLGFGKHEGDWELVQVGLDAGGEPELVTCSQHMGGERRAWRDVRRQRFDGAEHPVVYTAPFSHAMYFEPGAHPYLGGIDNPDGSRPARLPTIEEIGAWRAWPGRWGNSRGITPRLPWLGLGGESPRSPALQGERWERPGDYHAQAKGAAGRAAVRAARAGGALIYPRLERLTARLDGRRLVLDYSLGRAPPLVRAERLYVTVHELGSDEEDAAAGEVLLSSAVAIDAPAGEVSLQLPEPVDRCAVYASAFNRLRQRSDPLRADAAQGDDGPARRGGR